MHRRFLRFRTLWVPLLAGATCLAAHAAEALPAEVAAALQKARIPLEALSVVVQEAGSGRTLLAHQPHLPMNPASVIKLATTTMALDQLGPAWTWVTPVWLNGRFVAEGVFEGSLHIKGTGDPKLVMERMWLLLRRVMQLGVRELRGDIVLDNGAFALPEGGNGEFDGEAHRAYNVRAAALLLNYRAVLYTFTPDLARGIAVVGAEPPLAGLVVDKSVPLSQGACDDWAGALKASFAATRTRFAGAYPAACGEQQWPVADAAPASYAQRLVEGLWREMGGRLRGTVREGAAPVDLKPSFEQRSPPLLEVVREINKFSNNVMAQQLFLTLALQQNPSRPATPEAARELMRRWLAERSAGAGGAAGTSAGGAAEDPGPELVIDNGSGLSRETRISAALLARLLQHAYTGPWMSELMSSLPIAGIDGTMRRARGATGRAHLKTGSLRDVSSRAGYVLSDSGRRWVLVATVNHANGGIVATRGVFDALLQWVVRDGRDGGAPR